MARRNNPSLLMKTGALIKMTEGLRMIKVQRQRERIMLAREAQKLNKEEADTRKARHQCNLSKLSVHEKEIRLRKTEAEVLEIEARTKTLELRYKLDSVKLAKMDPDSFPDGTTAYECPICDVYYTNPNPNLLYCTTYGCNNQPLVKCVLNLN